MYLLEMIEDQGYDGIYTTSIVVSEDKCKLDILAISLKENLLEIYSKQSEFMRTLDKKYKDIRINCRRTTEEISEIKQFDEKLKLLYPDIVKYELFYQSTIVSHCDITFEIKEINII